MPTTQITPASNSITAVDPTAHPNTTQPQPCPTCGTCPTCGRSQAWWPYVYPTTQPWVNPIVYSTVGAANAGSCSNVASGAYTCNSLFPEPACTGG